MATGSREARRRRIVDGGSDRLALITGRIQTLPSSSSATESNHSHTTSFPPLISHDHDQPIELLDVAASVDIDNKSSSTLLPLHASSSESAEINADFGRIRDQPVLRKCQTNNEVLRAPSWEVQSRSQSSLVLSTVQESPILPSDTEHRLGRQDHRAKFVTPYQISSAIKATESARIYSSLAVSILVVLSFVGFRILGSRIIKSIVVFRPLYLVLITNVSIVLSRLLLDKQQGGFERTEQEANNVFPADGHGLAEQLGKAVELGLVLQKIVGALFMDCSVYAIVLICGLSVAQKLGW